MSRYIVPFGTVVEDTTVRVLDRSSRRSAKPGCRITSDWGGGPVNAGTAGAGYGGQMAPLLLAGPDERGQRAGAELGTRFVKVLVLPCLSQTRQTVIVDDRCYTVRPGVVADPLSPQVQRLLRDAAYTIVAPLAAADAALAARVLALAPRSIWQPSGEQLQDRDGTLRLMRRASITVMNDQEARLLTGAADPVAAIERLRRGGLSTAVVITDRWGAIAWRPNTWEYAAAVAVPRVERVVGAGDCFTGVLAVALAAGRSFQESLQLGQAAAARHVSGAAPLGSLDALAAWSQTVDRVSPADRSPKAAWKRRLASLAATAASLAGLIQAAGVVAGR